MKYIPLQGHACKLYEIHALTGISPVNYMKYIPLQGQRCKLYKIHTITGTIPCKIYEIRSLYR